MSIVRLTNNKHPALHPNALMSAIDTIKFGELDKTVMIPVLHVAFIGTVPTTMISMASLCGQG